jgi:hypothetical protein
MGEIPAVNTHVTLISTISSLHLGLRRVKSMLNIAAKTKCWLTSLQNRNRGSLFTQCQNIIMNISNENDVAAASIAKAAQECVAEMRNIYTIRIQKRRQKLAVRE